MIVFVCQSHQRPQLELDTSTVTETTDTVATEETTIKSLQDKVAQVTEATAVSVKTSINVSSYVPRNVYEDFKPSNYYRPDGYPIFERPSQQVTDDVFYGSQRLKRPNGLVYPLPTPKPDDKNVIFPQASIERVQLHSNRSNGPESRTPHKFTEVYTHPPKPMKHDYSGAVTKFSEYDNSFYEKYFGKYHGEMSHYPDFVHEPPKSYHSVTTRKK